MRRLISLKNLSEVSRNLSRIGTNNTTSTTTTCSFTIRTFHSVSNNTASNAGLINSFITPHSYHPFAHISPSIYISVRRRLHGFLCTSSSIKHFVSSTHSSKSSLAQSKLQILGTQFLKKSFDLNSSYRQYGKSWFQRLTSDNLVLGLIIANTAVFLLWRVADRSFMRMNFMISVDNFKAGRIHTLVTSAFSHNDIGHLIHNMIGLYFFGTSITRVFGTEFLLKLYLSGAVVGSIFYLVHHAYLAQLFEDPRTFRDPSKAPGLGASGAVNAIMLLDIFLFPKATLLFDFFIPVPAILLGIYIIGKDVLRIIEGDPQVSGSAHLGGAAVAAIAWLRLKGKIRF